MRNSNYYRINEWGFSNLPLDNMIEIYEDNKFHWIKQNSESLNKNNIIKILVKNNRVDMLGYIISTYPNEYTKVSENKDTFSPIQYAVWSYTETNVKKLISVRKNIINMIDMLVDNFKYKIFSTREQEIDGEIKYETVLGSLMSEQNLLHDDVKMKVYNYITQKDHSAWFIPEFRSYLNKLNKNNNLKFLNKILFISTKYTNEICRIMFKYLLGVKITKIGINEQIEFIIDTITSIPNSTDDELNLYFRNVNFTNKHIEIVSTILTNAEDWIKLDNIENSDEITEEDLEVISITSSKTNEINYKIYYSILGSFYYRSINKCEILEKIFDNIYSNGVETSWLIKALIQFISHAKLNYISLNPMEKKMIQLLTNNYFNSKIKTHDRFNIGYILSLVYYNYNNSKEIKILSSEEINELFIINL